MIGYGLPRILDLKFPDAVDISNYGLKSSAGQFPGKSGDYHGGRGRKVARRIWKKKERARAKAALRREINEYS